MDARLTSWVNWHTPCLARHAEATGRRRQETSPRTRTTSLAPCASVDIGDQKPTDSLRGASRRSCRPTIVEHGDVRTAHAEADDISEGIRAHRACVRYRHISRLG